MKPINVRWVFLLWLCAVVSQSYGFDPSIVENFPDIRGVPTQTDDKKASAFFDNGSWFGYGLPAHDETASYGAFTGPLLLTQQRWLSQDSGKLSLAINGLTRPLTGAKTVTLTYLPGALRQEYIFDDIHLTLVLRFSDAATALMQTTLTNLSTTTPVTAELSWSQRYWQPVKVKIRMGQAHIAFDQDARTTKSPATKPEAIDAYAKGMVLEWAAPARVRWHGETLTATESTRTLAPGSSQVLWRSQQLLSSAAEPNAIDWIKKQQQWFERAEHWQQHTEQLLARLSNSDNTDTQSLAVKSVNTLINNYRVGMGDLPGAGFFPSYHQGWFNGFWAWDSWKHAAAMAGVEPAMARAQIQTMFALQAENGMVPDVIYADKSENNWRNSKPPLAAWAVWLTDRADPDLVFLQSLWPHLLAYHAWWYRERDHDHNGLCEFGATDGTLEAAAWESGMDNAVRFDRATLLENGNNAWSMSQESVDLNSFLAAEKDYLSLIAARLNKPAEAFAWRTEAENLRQLIRAKMFYQGYFYDIQLVDKQPIKVRGPEAWAALWAGVPNREQAKAMANILLNESHFNSFVPLSSLDVSDARLAPEQGYWRGPVWLDQAYFAIAGLHRYGLHTEALQLQKKLFKNAQGLIGHESLRENYHPLTGAGLNAEHFSWSAAHILLLLQPESTYH